MPTTTSHRRTATAASDPSRAGALYFLGRPYRMYAAHYGVPLRAGRPITQRSRRADVG